MKFWFYKGRKLTDKDKEALAPEEQTQCREWQDRKPKDKPKQDYKWYNIDDSISKAVGNVPFNLFAGAPMRTQAATWQGGHIYDESGRTFPGVLIERVIPAYGEANDATSAINIAARSVYTWVRHQNSGHSNYEANDLMLYIAGMDSLYTAYYDGVRAYELAMTYTFENRYIPDMLLQAYGWNPDTIRPNLANFRYGLNLLASKLSSMCVPAKFDISKRHAFIARNTFMDSDSLRGQFFGYRMDGFLKFSPATNQSGGELVTVLPNRTTPTAWLAFMDSLVDPILSDEDMNIMSGDILKAYGRENLYSLSFVEESATASFQFLEDALAQFENAVSYGCEDSTASASTSTSGGTLSYSQASVASSETGYLTSTVTIDTTSKPSPNQFYLNSHKKDPNYENVIEWTRSMCGTSFGTELVLGFQMYTNFYKETTDPGYIALASLSFGTSYSISGQNPSTSYTDIMQLFTKLSMFDWHPTVYVYFDGTEDGSTEPYRTYIGAFLDIKVTAFLQQDQIDLLHSAAVMGALGKLTMTAK